MGNLKIGSGSTPAGRTAWQPYDRENTGIFVDVNTGAAGFTSTPVYITSLGGRNVHWVTTGASSVYSATEKGFTIYIRFVNGNTLTPEFANHEDHQWHVNWIGIEG